jgi:soluble lytic murein transglycosylase-like protein
MTKPWYYPVARARAVATRAASCHHRATVGALAAVLFLALLFGAATAPLDAYPANAVAASPMPWREPVSTTAVAGHAASAADPSIDALAGIVARKYRVSEDATREFVRTAYREGARHGVDPLLIVSVMAIESRFNPVAQSDGGAMGLMQVIPRYHAEKIDAADRASVLDPRTNIQIGVKILKEYIGRGGNELAGLQLYNGATGDSSCAYATRVLGEKQWLQDAVRHARDRARA